MDEVKDFLYINATSYACEHQTENDPHRRLQGAECQTSKPSYEDYKHTRREELGGKSTDGKESHTKSGKPREVEIEKPPMKLTFPLPPQ